MHLKSPVSYFVSMCRNTAVNYQIPMANSSAWAWANSCRATWYALLTCSSMRGAMMWPRYLGFKTSTILRMAFCFSSKWVCCRSRLEDYSVCMRRIVGCMQCNGNVLAKWLTITQKPVKVADVLLALRKVILLHMACWGHKGDCADLSSRDKHIMLLVQKLALCIF